MEHRLGFNIPEDKIQEGIINSVRLIYPNAFIFHVPNGGMRNAREAAKLKRMGTVAGVSDLILLYKGKSYFFEVKNEKGKQTDHQKEFQRIVEKQGFKYFIVKTSSEIINIIDKL